MAGILESVPGYRGQGMVNINVMHDAINKVDVNVGAVDVDNGNDINSGNNVIEIEISNKRQGNSRDTQFKAKDMLEFLHIIQCLKVHHICLTALSTLDVLAGC